MPTTARLTLEYEEGLCPTCSRPVELEFRRDQDAHCRDPVERSECPDCGEEIVSETRGTRYWYTSAEFAAKDAPARRLVRCSREWHALAVELHLAAVEILDADPSSLSQQFERAEAGLRTALAPAVERARLQLAATESEDAQLGQDPVAAQGA